MSGKKVIRTGRLYLRDPRCKGYTVVETVIGESPIMDIKKRIIKDEKNRPVAVEIDYQDWCKIEEALAPSTPKPPTNLSRHIGKLDWPIDGMEYQRITRSEWD